MATSWGNPATTVIGLDYLVVVPSRARCLSPSRVADDSTYPFFCVSTSQTQKLIRSDLSGFVGSPPGALHPDHGLGGRLLELPSGDIDACVKLSSLVPDDPTSDTNTEQLAHSATVRFGATPRWHMART